MLSRRRPTPSQAFSIQALESRVLLSADFAIGAQDFGIEFEKSDPEGAARLEISAWIGVVPERSANILKVYGTLDDDVVTVDPQGSDVLVRVTDRAGQLLAEQLVAGTAFDAMEIRGGHGDDTIRNNTSRKAYLNGHYGDDDIRGGFGTDIISGHDGDDVLDGRGGDDFLYGGGEHDTLTGGAGDDLLSGADGIDSYLFDGGMLGLDVVVDTGSDDGDRLDFSALAGRIEKLELDSASQQTVHAAHLQLILSNGGIEVVRGTAFNDNIHGDGRDNLIYGLRGDDALFSGGGTDLLVGGDGRDSLHGSNAGDDELRGGPDNDVLYGGGGSDHLLGEHGDDYLYGGADLDLLDGGWGHDHLYGNRGRDVLLGSFDHDTLVGGNGDDRLEGGPGNDTTYGGSGGDIHVFAGAWLGNDTAYDYSLDIDHLDFSQFFGGVTLDTQIPVRQTVHPQYLTLALISEFEYVTGSPYNDVIRGNSRQNHIVGGGGNDLLEGRGGSDVLRGELGADSLHGDDGNDFLFGGDGDDELCDGDGYDWLEGGRDNDLMLASEDIFTDRLFGQEGYDVLYGGDWFDELWGGAGSDWFLLEPDGTIMDWESQDTEGEGAKFLGIGFEFRPPAPPPPC